MTKRDELSAYRAQMGSEKAERQAAAAGRLFACCGNERHKGHDPRCRFMRS